MNTTKLELSKEMEQQKVIVFKLYLTIMAFLVTLLSVTLFFLYKGAGDEVKVAAGTVLLLLNGVFVYVWPKKRAV